MAISDPRRLLAICMVLFVLSAVVACGDDSATSTPGNAEDATFAATMIDHHRGAIEMSQAAKRDAKHPQVKALASEIIRAQESEIERLTAIGTLLSGEGIKPSDHELGMSEESMGLDPTIDEFESAKDPDKEFIDSMIPHHAGAIAMANDLLKHGKNPELRAMAEAIIVAQHSEILKLQRWRKAWYGAKLPVPEGGSASYHEKMSERGGHGEMGHE